MDGARLGNALSTEGDGSTRVILACSVASLYFRKSEAAGRRVYKENKPVGLDSLTQRASSRISRFLLAELGHDLQPRVRKDCKHVALRLNLTCRRVSYASTKFNFFFHLITVGNSTFFYSLIFINCLVPKEFEFATTSPATSA